MLKIYVTNLKKYNEGALVGEWVDLPHEDIESVINKISNDGADELFITDYESELEGLEVGEYDNIETLDSIMQEVDNLTDSELLAFQAYLLNGSSLVKDLKKYVKAIIQFIMIVMICQMSHIKLLMRADYLTECRKH